MNKTDDWPTVLLLTINTTIGLQILRTLWPYLRYLLYSRLDLNPLHVGLLALALFATAFGTPWLQRRMGALRLLLLSAGGLGLARLTMQVWSGEPIVDMLLAFAGIICFITVLPTSFVAATNAGFQPQFTAGLLLGVALDTALNGLFLTYDFIWQSGLLPLGLTFILVIAQGVSLWNLLKTRPKIALATISPNPLAWLAVGPFLALQILTFQNLGRLAVLTHWTLPAVFGWILLSHVIGIWIATTWQPRRPLIIGGVGTLFISLLIFTEQPQPMIAALAFLGGQITLALLMSVIPTNFGEATASSDRRTAMAHGLGMMALAGFIFIAQTAYTGLTLPLEQIWFQALAGMIIVAVAVVISFSQRPQLYPFVTSWFSPILSLFLLLMPIAVFWGWQSPQSTTPISGPVRVMTYNIHNGFNTQGHLDIEALVQVIEAEQPDIIALQEVSRGDTINGAVDLLSWLVQQLDWPYAYAPAGNGLWGQATFSRYPIISAETHPLPPHDIPTRRSFAHLQIDVGWAEPLNLINTHYEPRWGRDTIQRAHTEALLDYLDAHQLEQIIIVGDLNATPDRPPMQSLFAYGFSDAIEKAGLTPGYTAHSERLGARIDYILISPDLICQAVVIPDSTASDHLGVAATVRFQGK